MHITDIFWPLPDVERFEHCERIAAQMVVNFDGGAWEAARLIWIQADLDADERDYCWGHFDSRQRAFLKGEDRAYLREQ